jgi:hypothetical protein
MIPNFGSEGQDSDHTDQTAERHTPIKVQKTTPNNLETDIL